MPAEAARIRMHGSRRRCPRWAQETADTEAPAATRAWTLARKAAKRSLAGGAEDGRSVAALAAQSSATRVRSAICLAEVADLRNLDR